MSPECPGNRDYRSVARRISAGMKIIVVALVFPLLGVAYPALSQELASGLKSKTCKEATVNSTRSAQTTPRTTAPDSPEPAVESQATDVTGPEQNPGNICIDRAENNGSLNIKTVYIFAGRSSKGMQKLSFLLGGDSICFRLVSGSWWFQVKLEGAEKTCHSELLNVKVPVEGEGRVAVFVSTEDGCKWSLSAKYSSVHSE
jgi:hypothetical protein